MAATSPLEFPLGPLVVDVQGKELSPEDKEVLAHPLVGGLILFTRNYESPEQLGELIRQVHQIRTPSLAVCVDQEGGTVQRFRKGFTRLPAAQALGKLYHRDREHAYRVCTHMGWLMAAELRAVGVDISFAPVVDLNWGTSEVIGGRAFHRNPYTVSELASRYIAGMHQAGMKSVIKHFPGHGHVHEDSHKDMPVDKRSFQKIQGEDLIPFEHLATAYNEGLMTAHIIFPEVDEVPVTFSDKWLQQTLRGQMNFSGVVFSDDLNMHAAHLHEDIESRVRAAFQAGCDVALLCNNRPAVNEVLDHLKEDHNPVASLRLFRMRGAPEAESLEDLHQLPMWKEAVELAARHAEEDESELNL